MKSLIFFGPILAPLVVGKFFGRPGHIPSAGLGATGHGNSARAVLADTTIFETQTAIEVAPTSVVFVTSAIPPSASSSTPLVITQTVVPLPVAQSQVEPTPSSEPAIITPSVFESKTPSSDSGSTSFVEAPAPTSIQLASAIEMSSANPTPTSIESSVVLSSVPSTQSLTSFETFSTSSPIVGGVSGTPTLITSSMEALISSPATETTPEVSLGLIISISSSESMVTNTEISTTTSSSTVSKTAPTLANPSLNITTIVQNHAPPITVTRTHTVTPSTMAHMVDNTNHPTPPPDATMSQSVPAPIELPDTTVTVSGMKTTLTLTMSNLSSYTGTIVSLTLPSMDSATGTQPSGPVASAMSAYVPPTAILSSMGSTAGSPASSSVDTVTSAYIGPSAIPPSSCACPAPQTVTVTETTWPAIPTSVPETSEEPNGAGIEPTSSADGLVMTVYTTVKTQTTETLMDTWSETIQVITDTSTAPCTTSTSNSLEASSIAPVTTETDDYPPVRQPKSSSLVPYFVNSNTSVTSYMLVYYGDPMPTPTGSPMVGYSPAPSPPMANWSETTQTATATSTAPCTTSTSSWSILPISTIVPPASTWSSAYSPIPQLTVHTTNVTTTTTIPCSTACNHPSAYPMSQPQENSTANGTWVHQPMPTPVAQYTAGAEYGARGGELAFLLGFVALFFMV